MQNQENKKKTWGGAREGAGRKKDETKEITKAVTFQASQTTIAILETVGNKAKFIREAIQEKAQRDGLL